MIVSSIAELLCERASRDTFEAVWAKTGKPWFAPAQVRPLQFPYAYDPDIQKRFGCSQNLLASIVERIDPASFDVALISGGSLGIPIAAAIKGMDRAAMALGGTLQVLFGVGGRRWWNWPDWQVQYFTPAWISVPPALVPKGAERLEGGPTGGEALGPPNGPWERSARPIEPLAEHDQRPQRPGVVGLSPAMLLEQLLWNLGANTHTAEA